MTMINLDQLHALFAGAVEEFYAAEVGDAALTPLQQFEKYRDIATQAYNEDLTPHTNALLIQVFLVGKATLLGVGSEA